MGDLFSAKKIELEKQLSLCLGSFDSQPKPQIVAKSSRISFNSTKDESAAVQLLDGSCLLLSSSSIDSSNDYVVDVHAFGGQVFAFLINPTTTAQDLKQKLEENGVCFAQKQRLFFQGWELQDSQIICTIVGRNKTIALLPEASELVSFFLVDLTGKQHTLNVKPETTVFDLKKQLSNRLAFPLWKKNLQINQQSKINDLKDHDSLPIDGVGSPSMIVTYKQKECNDSNRLSSCGIERTSQLYLVIQAGFNEEIKMMMGKYFHLLLDDSIITMVKDVQEGIINGMRPELVRECSGGTYFLKNAKGKCVGVFKPVDEEPYAPDNPKGLTGLEMSSISPLKRGISIGQAAIRECACYMIDHENFVGVPHTVMLRILKASFQDDLNFQMELKCGSFQKYHHHKCLAEELSPCFFDVIQVQKIACFDIRVLNGDRHAGNILVVEDDEYDDDDDEEELGFLNKKNHRGLSSSNMQTSLKRLVPIDHGFTLPNWKHLEDIYLEWIYWPQTQQPVDPLCINYISHLDPEQDASMLRISLPSLSEDSLFSLYIGTRLLQHCILQRNCTLSKVGELLTRPSSSQPSVVETLLSKTESELFHQHIPLSTPITLNPQSFMKEFISRLDQYLEDNK